MNENTLIVVRAFRGLDKEAGCDTTDKKPIGRATAIKYGWKDPKSKRMKKAVITKESLSKNVVGADGVIDVAVERINKSAKLTAVEALDAMKKMPDERRPSGVTNAKVSEVGMMRSKARAEKAKQEQISAMGDSLGPKVAMLMAKFAEGAGTGQPDPYAAFQQMQEDGNTVSKAIPGLDPNVVLQGQQQGVDMTPGAIKRRLGAHEQIAKGKKILRDDNQNGVPDVAEGAPGAGGRQAPGGMPPGAGAPQAGGASSSPLLAAMKQRVQPQQDPAQMIAAAKLRMPDLTKTSNGGEEEGGEPTPNQASALMNFIASQGGEGVDDSEVHNFSENMGVNPHEAEEEIYKTLGALLKGRRNDIIAGGEAAGQPNSEFPAAQIEKGTKVEKEHTPSTAVAAEISKDHLTESDTYYDHLAKMEDKMPKTSSDADAQNTEKKEEEEETKPGVVKLELASDEPVKKAPEKKPEKDSENEAETKKANMGAPAAPLSSVQSGLPRREGIKTTNRQDVFDDVSKWSLGRDM